MPIQVTQQNEPHTHTVTIAASGNLSTALTLPNGHELAAIIMPDVWTAAGISFQASPTVTAFANVFGGDGNEVTYTVVATNYIAIPPGTIHGASKIKVRSGTSATPVAQAAERELTLITRPTA